MQPHNSGSVLVGRRIFYFLRIYWHELRSDVTLHALCYTVRCKDESHAFFLGARDNYLAV